MLTSAQLPALAQGASPLLKDRNENTPEPSTEQTQLSLLLAKLSLPVPLGPPHSLSRETGWRLVLMKADCFKASWQILLKESPSLNLEYYSHLYGRIKINFLSYNKNDKNESLGSK